MNSDWYQHMIYLDQTVAKVSVRTERNTLR